MHHPTKQKESNGGHAITLYPEGSNFNPHYNVRVSRMSSMDLFTEGWLVGCAIVAGLLVLNGLLGLVGA